MPVSLDQAKEYLGTSGSRGRSKASQHRKHRSNCLDDKKCVGCNPLTTEGEI